ncbi:energy transducer TonB [Microbacteriaceae bacterium K1510]|nr:energy transducer TonB [Microbacteriaceae bacterium K1510]
MKMPLAVLLTAIAIEVTAAPVFAQMLGPIESKLGVAAIERAAPSPKGDISKLSAKERWTYDVVRYIYRFQYYPGEAVKKREHGIVKVKFKIDRDGNILSTEVQQSSGSAALDNAGLSIVRRASHIPLPPADVSLEDLVLVVPIAFHAEMPERPRSSASRSQSR